MPTYEFVNTKTKKVEEHFMSIKDYDQFKEDNPHLERVILEAPGFNYTGQGDFNSKTDNSWKEVLAKIGEKHPASPLAEKYVRKSTKEVKTKQVWDKHRKKVTK